MYAEYFNDLIILWTVFHIILLNIIWYSKHDYNKNINEWNM
jgi:hypothetical protein